MEIGEAFEILMLAVQRCLLCKRRPCLLEEYVGYLWELCDWHKGMAKRLEEME